MVEISNIILSIMSFILALLSIVFVIITLKQNTKILEQGQKQIEESKRQFTESKLLECQPFLQMELIEDWSNYNSQYVINIPIENGESETIYGLCKTKNVGNGSATNLRYSWKCDTQSDLGVFPLNAIMSGDEYYFQVTLEKQSIRNSYKIEFVWEYEDILGYTYEQKSILRYEDERLNCIENDPPVFKDEKLI